MKLIRSRVKLLFAVLGLSCLLGGGAAALCLLLLPALDSAERIAATVVITLYAFFLLPDLVFAVEYFEARANGITPRTAFFVGYYFGDIIALLLILLAPISGTVWYLDTAVGLIRSRKRRGKDVFEDV